MIIKKIDNCICKETYQLIPYQSTFIMVESEVSYAK